MGSWASNHSFLLGEGPSGQHQSTSVLTQPVLLQRDLLLPLSPPFSSLSPVLRSEEGRRVRQGVFVSEACRELKLPEVLLSRARLPQPSWFHSSASGIALLITIMLRLWSFNITPKAAGFNPCQGYKNACLRGCHQPSSGCRMVWAPGELPCSPLTNPRSSLSLALCCTKTKLRLCLEVKEPWGTVDTLQCALLLLSCFVAGFACK